MKVTAERIPGSQVLLKIEIPPEQVEQAIEKTYRDVSRRVRIPGFRPGKAPRGLVERYVGGPEVVRQEGIERLIDDSFRKALQETGTRPIGEADLSEKPEFHPGEPLVFEAAIPVAPSVELGDYKSIRLQPVAVEATPQQVNEFIDALVESRAEWVSVEREIREEDHAVLDVQGTAGSVPTLYGPHGETLLQTTGGREVYNTNEHEHLVNPKGEPEFAPGFDEELIGLKPNSEKTFGLTLPADFPDAELANQSIVFHVKVHDVKEKHVPELNDEFAKSVGGGDTVESLREVARQQIQARLERDARSIFEDSLVEAAVTRSTLDIPDVLIERQIDAQIEDLKADLAREHVSWEDYLQAARTTPEKVREDLRPAAERTVQSYLVVREIGRQENIVVEPEEVNAEIEATAAQFGPARNVIRERLSTRDQRERIESRMFYRKVVQLLSDIAQQPAPAEGEETLSARDADESAAEPPNVTPAATIEPSVETNEATTELPPTTPEVTPTIEREEPAGG